MKKLFFAINIFFFICILSSNTGAGLNVNFPQNNQSHSAKGALRGLHYQLKHPQGRLIFAVTDETVAIGWPVKDNLIISNKDTQNPALPGIEGKLLPEYRKK